MNLNMEYYYFLKFIHIISATILFGTGIGTAFFMLMAYLSKNSSTVKYTTKHVVLADWIFTTPAIIIQFVSGIVLMMILHYPFNSLWFVAVMCLFLFAGGCWIPVVFIQYRLKNIAADLTEHSPIPVAFAELMRKWVLLGVGAFMSLLLIYGLMITRYAMKIAIF